MDTYSLPLEGITVLDFSANGPGPFATRLLADYGADVISVEPPAEDPQDTGRMYGRGKRSIILDLKADGAQSLILDMLTHVDIVVESMRPGKMESLGLGPAVMHKKNPKLIYGRLSAFGQTGPLSTFAGHDINAAAVGGPLAMVGLDQPLPTPGLIGDFAGGSLLMVIGILLALRHLERHGHGQVVDASMTDGCALIAGGVLPLFNKGQLGPRGENMLDGSRPYYGTYRCLDGKWIALGSIEPKFYDAFLEAMDLKSTIDLKDQYSTDTVRAENARKEIASRFSTKSRDEWIDILGSIDACLSPVLEPDELADFHHNQERGLFYHDKQGLQVDVFPRMSEVSWKRNAEAPCKGEHSHEVLRDFGLTHESIERAIRAGIVVTAQG